MKTELKTGFLVLTHVRPIRRTRTRKKKIHKKRELDEFSHENPNPVLRVLNKFGSLVSVVLLLTWGCCYWLFLFLFLLGAATLLLLFLG